MRKTYKKIIALCAVLIFALALIPVQTFAIGDPFSAIAIGGLGGASGAGLFGSMASATGFNLSFGSGTTVDQMDAVWNVLNPDHVYFNGEKGQVTEPDPVTGTPTLYDYIQVDLSDWLEAQQNFVSEFVSSYNVTDNSSGSVSTPNNLDGFINGSFIGQVNAPFTIGQQVSNGPFVIGIKAYGSGKSFYFSYNGVEKASINNINDNFRYFKVSLGSFSSNVWNINITYYNYFNNTEKTETRQTNISDNTYVSYNWTSGTVNEDIFDNWTSPRVKIPASSWTPSDPVNWSVQEFLSELTYKMNNSAGDDIILDDADNPPVPPVPVPTIPLGDIPTDEWYDLFGLPVLEGQEEIHQDLQDFNDSVSDGIDDVIGELEDIESDVESIDTNIGIGNGLLRDLKSIGQSIQSTLSSILSGVTDLVQEIVLSTETFIAGLLNSIMGGLGGWLSTMREAFSIWHYVVEWVGSISTVFSWFWSVAGSTSYYIQLPIYASLAGAVVLAFYKRFGK